MSFGGFIFESFSSTSLTLSTILHGSILREGENPLRAEATFSRNEMASEKQPLPTTVQFSIVHAQNLSRDLQATGSSNLREFRGNQNWENYLRTTLLELLFCFSALPVWF